MSYTSAKSRPRYTFDADLEMKDAHLVAADDPAQVDSADKILDCGKGFFKADLVIDVTAIEIASNDELYKICFQLSNSSTFASGIVDNAILELGALEATEGDADSTTGRYVLAVSNRDNNGTTYRYARVFTAVEGTIATGINYSAFLSKVQR